MPGVPIVTLAIKKLAALVVKDKSDPIKTSTNPPNCVSALGAT